MDGRDRPVVGEIFYYAMHNSNLSTNHNRVSHVSMSDAFAASIILREN